MRWSPLAGEPTGDGSLVRSSGLSGNDTVQFFL